MKWFLLLILVSCVTPPGGEGDAIDSAFEVDPPTSGQIITGKCFEDRYATPEESIIRKLDIAIVIDTSGSIISERAQIAEGFDYFLDQLPEEVDLNIAVILAHGDNTGFSGKLYQKSTEPIVLSNETLTNEEIKSHLKLKMQSPNGDGETDGGELGLYSYIKSITTNLNENKALGFYRDDAALNVIFVADEQDICAEYPDGITPVLDPQGAELRSLSKYCKDDDGNFIVTPELAFNKTAELKSNIPYVLGGVLYNNLQTLPVGGENELGYGYLETVKLSGGIVVDMASGDYGSGLENLGRLATVKLEPINEFQLSTPRVEQSSIEVFVNNINTEFNFDPELNTIKLQSDRDPFSLATIKYCEKQEKEKEKEVSALALGGNHSCAILSSGDLRCWGDNSFGQLGIGNFENMGDDEPLYSVPNVKLGGLKVIDVSAGFKHTCAVLETGGVKCWGENLRGQLGRGNTDSVSDPSLIDEIPLKDEAKRVYTGTRFSCALLKNKKIQCWGNNQFGQLGIGSTDSIGDDETLDSHGYTELGENVVGMDISTISFHSCAILESGSIKCFGRNSSGQLGIGSTENIGDDELLSTIPAINFGNKVLQLATGNQHTCALVSGQDIRCWGNNSRGQIGLGRDEIIGDNESATSVATVDLGADNFNMIASGNLHNCAISSDFNVHCFGYGATGALGLGSNENLGDNETPAMASKVTSTELFNEVQTGLNHTCLISKDEGKVTCFGENTLGQLGTGNKTSTNSPLNSYIQFSETK